jgi:hypothetical protein
MAGGIVFKHTIVITGIALISALGAVAGPVTTSAASAPDPGSVEMICIGLAGLMWLGRKRVFKALGRE